MNHSTKTTLYLCSSRSQCDQDVTAAPRTILTSVNCYKKIVSIIAEKWFELRFKYWFVLYNCEVVVCSRVWRHWIETGDEILFLNIKGLNIFYLNYDAYCEYEKELNYWFYCKSVPFHPRTKNYGNRPGRRDCNNLQLTKDQWIFNETKNCEQVRTEFEQRFLDKTSPIKKTVYKIVRKFIGHDTILNRN